MAPATLAHEEQSDLHGIGLAGHRTGVDKGAGRGDQGTGTTREAGVL